jgi:geranylgeranyl diphosphate synthase type II
MGVIVDAAFPRDRDTERESLAKEIEAARTRIDVRLAEVLRGHDDACPRLIEAMRYSLLAPGKRVRPLLAVLTAADFGRGGDGLIDFGCALELVHCASLMLDDLPCMDDASTRRGQPANHVKFGDATTTLAAVGLLNQAYGLLARCQSVESAVRSRLVSELSEAVGTAGLVSGQSRDLDERKRRLDDKSLDRINRQKTGVLFELAVVGAGLVLDLPQSRLAALFNYAGHVGLAFQAADDLLDASRMAADSGKDCCIDVGKAGSVHQVGERALRERLESEMAAAEALLEELELDRGRLHYFVRALFRDLL